MRKLTCVRCPKWKEGVKGAGSGVCLIKAQTMLAKHPQCPYGQKLTTNEYMRVYMANLRKRNRTKGETELVTQKESDYKNER